ncbi:Putative auxin efflux carrier component 8 [Striga hermonthica]|uniref:Auxin efflux carrier component n=1 Tax=Striga hermonthica TaxID=68872 RepID=A0A9N7NHZ4_STRHE|nr:Putative auxin efflux carrier component 8 [Striga hermonthica]
MIGWEDIYKVVGSMVPLYVPLGLGYASVRWWRMFKPKHCDVINRLNCYFVLPFFTFHFSSGIDPYRLNYRFLAGDVVAKAIAGAILALWATIWRSNNFPWVITSFSLSSLNNPLVVGVPVLRAMYGSVGEDLAVQSSIMQSFLWFPTLLFMLQINHEQQRQNSDHENQIGDSDKNNDDGATNVAECTTINSSLTRTTSVGSSMTKVLAKLAKNPNCYACALGLIWALLAKRWNFDMPEIVEGSVLIMAKAGSGVAMFTMGLFMALQEKVIACGVKLGLYGMVLRFVGGPLTTAMGSFALGLRSNILRMAIIQAALPEAITAFVYAQEYGLHANVLSTAVIFGTIVSLPLLIAFYAVLEVIHI